MQEAREAGVVDWLADRIVEQRTPHGIPLDGDDGLLPALATLRAACLALAFTAADLHPCVPFAYVAGGESVGGQP